MAVLKCLKTEQCDVIEKMVTGFVGGERDYSNLKGDTGRLVYPAGFLYVYSAIQYVTGGEVYLAQVAFGRLFTVVQNFEFHVKSQITNYRRECLHDDRVDSLTSVEPVEDAEAVSKIQGTNGSTAATENNEDLRRFLHLLRASRDGLEINRGRTAWRKKHAR
ncbi:hypothetical protein SO802_008349 [Lithocarpus litseifolius]|uniref:dolichyl-P-Man:Man5GlcNAc2-PP-dolichol alpha-1,3-mannosyltransferase n=1 Tax=Lithocarpus litseifolius TaxID=425828 RepID=A0AAW2D8C1_9ROSI